MRITIRAMCQKRDDLDQRIIECRSQLYQNCPAVLVQSIRDKIQQLNSELFQFLHQIKTQKLTNLVVPSSNLEPPKDNQLAVVTIPNNFLTALQIKTFFKNLTTASPNGLFPTASSQEQTFSSKNAGTIFLNLNSIATLDLSTSNPMYDPHF